VRNYQINKASQEGRVNEVSHELGLLGYGAAGNTGSCYGKSPLVKKEAVVLGGPRVVFKAKEVAAYETIGGGTEGKGVGSSKLPLIYRIFNIGRVWGLWAWVSVRAVSDAA
jgi:hypothetical protein